MWSVQVKHILKHRKRNGASCHNFDNEQQFFIIFAPANQTENCSAIIKILNERIVSYSTVMNPFIINDMLTEYFSDFSHVIGNSSCSLIVNNANCLDSMCSICSKFWCQNVKVGSLSPITFHNINIEFKTLLLIDPEQTELANQEWYYSVSRR